MTWLTPQDVSRYVLQGHLPLGRAWGGFRIPGKLGERFLSALARVHQDAWQFLHRMSREIDYRTTTQLVTEWESSVGIPDACLPSGATIDERRAWIAFRLKKTRWNTYQDWQDLAELFGVSVKITPGWLIQEPSLYDIKYPMRYREFPKLGRFRIYIDQLDVEFGGYPYDGRVDGYQYPIPYTSAGGRMDAFRCFIERIAPANVLIIWNEFPAISPGGNGVTYADEYDDNYS